MKYNFEYTISIGERLDKFLHNELNNNYSRSKLAKIIAKGLVTVNGKTIKKAGYELTRNDKIEITIEETNEFDKLKPINIPIEIVYEDEYLAVINKPAGIAVHPAPSIKEATLVNALKYHFQKLSEAGGTERAGIVHRLDKETSGLLIVAKNDKTHTKLSEMFQNREIVKIYKAVVYGRFKDNEGTIDLPIGRAENDRKKMIVRKDGRNAVTHYKVMENIDMFSIVNLSLETGRTHQIRVHLTHYNHSIIGDKLYGVGRWKGIENTKLQSYVKNFKRHALHSALLKFSHPETGKEILCKKDFPQDIQELISTIKNLTQ
jgi:23S rRNA pseudouridine1911/1915/1917 synthase